MKKIHKFILVFTIFFSLNFYANAKDNNYKVVKTYKEEGISGQTFSRPKLLPPP